MDTKKAHTFAAKKSSLSTRFEVICRITVIIFWGAALFGINTKFAAAQANNFYQTGLIRAVISETETNTVFWKGAAADVGLNFSDVVDPGVKFYFTYSVIENGTPIEKWVSLPKDRAWSQVSNQKVLVSGSLKNEALSNVSTTVLEPHAENYLSSPPRTAGVYKIVAVLLTIQPQSVTGKPADLAASTLTPEQVRNQLFNDPDSVNNFYREASYGMLEFAGVNHPQVDVIPVTIQATISNNCQDQVVHEFTPIVRQRLLEQNIDTTNGSVDLGIIFFKEPPGCVANPGATRAALGQRGVTQWVWMPESWHTGSLIMAHEIGHALGGNHPISLRCTNFNDPQSCIYVDAFDRDFMTSFGRSYHLPNNHNRRRWGWHPPGVFDSPSNGFVRMFDLRSPSIPFIKDGARQGRFFIRQLTGGFNAYDIYPEGRQNWGLFDKFNAADEAFRAGVTVRMAHRNYADPSAVTVIIDPNNTPEADDAPLRANQQISIGGVTIKCVREHHPKWGTRMSIQE
jgi:hypothetical protein